MTIGLDLADLAATGGDASARIRRALSAVRSHLGLQIAYVSRFSGDQSIFREVDAPGLEHLIKSGDTRSLDDVYCRHILAGRLPELIPDTAREPLAAAMPITAAASIGSHVSVPIRLANGDTYGMFCCIGFQPDPSLNIRDLQTMRAFAEIASFEINREVEAERVVDDVRSRLGSVVDDDNLTIVFQPIWDVDSMTPCGFECLSRFMEEPRRSPDQWFAEAAKVGLGPMLELQAIRTALRHMADFPDNVYLAVNASPATILSPGFMPAFEEVDVTRVILEITEHSVIGNYDDLVNKLMPLRVAGLRLAIDDAGAGYSSLRHILNMQPDFIKLDIGLTQNIDLDPARKALARALVGFADDTGSRIIAEGVERDSELATLRALGVGNVQGYLLGRPMPLESALAICHAGRPASRINAA
jgi:EAL domain-containing protein (putative c-di-GMP-specific phosphodiesterase class I)